MTLSLLSDRYERLTEIPWWDQARLRAARVLVVGAGALGNEIVKDLALLGAGHIAILDFDVIEPSNLTRSVLFRMDDLGRAKAVVAAERAREINPDVRTVALDVDVANGLGLGFVRRVDLVLGGVDSVGARIALNRLCRRAGVLWIDGALRELDGMVRAFHPSDGACYECGLTRVDYEIESRRHECQVALSGAAEVVPTSPTGAAVVGAWQVQEAVKWIHGLPLLRSESVVFSGRSFETRRIRLVPSKSCIGHESSLTNIIELEGVGCGISAACFLSELDRRFGLGGISVELPFEVAESIVCPVCRTLDLDGRPARRVSPEELPCARCGTLRTIRLRHVLDRSWPWPERSLAETGVAPLEVLPVRAQGQPKRFVELTGDKTLVSWRDFLMER